MWIKLLKVQYIEVNGKMVTYHPGDWLDVGKQTANRWLLTGIAEKPNYDISKDFIDTTAGILATKPLNDVVLSQLKHIMPSVQIIFDDKLDLAFTETLIFSAGVKPRYDLYPFGFKFLKDWQIAIPLHSYSELANHIGDETDKAVTKEVIRDLRVPTYDTRLVFVRRCSQTIDLIETWKEEKKKASNDNLAFHRAFYKIKPVLLALPTSWVQ